jgi:hypothetical protein
MFAATDPVRADVRATACRLAIFRLEAAVMSVTVATLGFPRIGPRRELKTALESYWAGKTNQAALLATAADLRSKAWARQRDLGADIIPSNDFSLYDHVLDTTAMVGAIPPIYSWSGGELGLETYFAMARGAEGDAAEEGCAHGHAHDGKGAPAAEMTKWLDTNYHYLVPEFTANQAFRLASTKAVQEYREAKAQGIETWARSATCCLAKPGVRTSSLCRSCHACCPSTPKSCGFWLRPGPPGCRSTSRA